MEKIVASVCLYGNQRAGYAYYARAENLKAEGGWTSGGNLSGELEHASVAVWQAVDNLRDGGVVEGLCRILTPGGQMYADVALEAPMPYYGALGWRSVSELEPAVG